LKNNLYKIIVFCVVVLSVLGGGAFYIHEKQKLPAHPMSIPPDYYYLDDPNDIYGKTGIVSIAGREFEIPVAFVQGNFDNGRKEGSVLLRYVLPDYKSILEFPDPEIRNQLAAKGLIRSTLLMDSSSKAPFEDVLQRNLERPVFEGSFVLIEDFERYRASNWKDTDSTRPKDILVKRDATGKITDFLRCTPPKRALVPSCSHSFHSDGLYFQVSWNKDELSKWKEHKEDVVKIVQKFEMEN
jgi:hypothetical protein